MYKNYLLKTPTARLNANKVTRHTVYEKETMSAVSPHYHASLLLYHFAHHRALVQRGLGRDQSVLAFGKENGQGNHLHKTAPNR